MGLADTSYVREQDGMFYVGATQITASSLIASWRNEGYSAEELQSDFPALSLAQVYGTIAYYLDHQQELDAQFATEDQEYYQQRERDREADPDFYRLLDQRRARLRKRLRVSDGTSRSDGSDDLGAN
ncbi:MAG TPA: DUF433 domain-containing protein [Ktedonobacterales bacterium]|jgi:uncharacterized protein (DUF433 family)|nr:DUF433 domain-containing protein [Ktedonobacterales bacterium]